MKKVVTASLILLSLLANLTAFARTGEGEPQALVELRGTVIDEQNAYIPAASITLDDGKGNHYTAVSDERGQYHLQVKPGVYTVTVEVEGFAKFTEQVDLSKRRRDDLNIKLEVAISEQVEVQDNAAGISTDPDRNLSAITLTEKDLEALPDDPDDLLSTLKQMAGAAGGGDDAMVYVDGFHERGQIPPKEAILRISINQNPFAAEYQEPGSARIEIITKPGADTYHGSFRFNFNDESLNARNPFYPDKPAYQQRNFAFNFTGPIIHNRWGFFADFDRRFTDDNTLVNATVLDPLTHQAVPFVQSILAPSRQTMFSVRTDFMATKKHTFGVQYRYNDIGATNQGVTGFNLPERAFNRNSHEDTLRLSMTSILSEHMVNESRVQLSRRTNSNVGLSDAPSINVLDSFYGGGANLFTDNKDDNLDFTDNVSYTWKTHTFKAGFRAESERFTNLNRSNFAGTFVFTGNPLIGETSLDVYSRAIAGDPLARPTQFSISRGDPFIGFSQWQFGSFAQDDWKVSPRLTLSFGLRNEFQTHLQDKLNFAPRFGLAWQADKAKKSTIRAGAGVFFTGLDDSITAETIRLDGLHQLQFTIINPDFFPNVPASLVGSSSRLPTIRIKSEGLNDPYSIIGTVSYERQLPWKMLGSVTYKWTRGVHLLRSRNINAPELTDGQFVSPFPGEGPILQYESTGLSTRNEFNFFLRTGFSRTLTFFSGYTLSWTRSNTDGANTMPANPFDLTTEWGRASNDSRHNIFLGGSLLTRWDIRLNPMVIYRSSRPFNITTGTDLNRDLSFSDRPSFAQAGDPAIIQTPFGNFNPTPLPGEVIVPRNFGDGPSFLMVNLNVSKTFGFGPAPNAFGQGNGQGGNNRGNRGGGGAPRGGGGARGGFGGPMGGGPMGGFFGGDSRHKYNLTLGVNMNNVLNHTNVINYTGNLSSPFFGIATQAMNGRRIEAQLRFSF